MNDDAFKPAASSHSTDTELPFYEGVGLADIVLVTSPDTAAEAWRTLQAEEVIGFDTEAKPTFNKGEASSGPHLIQLATATRVYLFQVHCLHDPQGLKAVLESKSILKVGFGLDSDVAQLHGRLGIAAQHVLDLSRVLRSGHGGQALGAKTAVAKYFGRRLQKSKRTTTSNWSNRTLTERQILYAANDAQIALRVYHAALSSSPALHAAIKRIVSPTAAADAERIGDGPQEAIAFRPMVKRIALGMLKTLPASVQADDLIQDGMLGLLDAVIRSSKQSTARQFEHYVAQRVRGAMLDGLRANDIGTRRVRHDMRNVEAAIQQLGHRLGRAPNEGEVAAELNMPLAAYQRLLQEAQGYSLISLDDLDGGDYLQQCACSDLDPLVVLERAAFRHTLGAALDALPEQERPVMQFYYGEDRSMQEIGHLLGITVGRVSQIHAQAIARLRAAILRGSATRSPLEPRRQVRLAYSAPPD